MACSLDAAIAQLSLTPQESGKLELIPYKDETQLPTIIALIADELSEPYSIYVYRYFIHQWPELCFLALVDDEPVGTIVCKLEDHRGALRGYIAMLAVKPGHRGRKIATKLVERAIAEMVSRKADEVCLETEVTNPASMRLYENLGFLRIKRLHRYYLNANDAFRYKLPLQSSFH
ncbi:acyl-CoA N-acyltransferase [Protomyces lactucae-debilis]|uniref:Acyl-CoA N-acyltransferase n=1 Tax=Protomyces lactucae-debilis TaxID=2754530 RepID=A0A1Y2F7D1_PROLT|nr:acyl-CoA N-acyltransferase [Protomyces lactucae-debilis]ORY79394.1 acyl-CoA N-acyltransferase [Protomyces lactucae-debilis]